MRGRGDSSWATYPAGSQTRIQHLQEAASLTVLPCFLLLLPQPKATVGDGTTESVHICQRLPALQGSSESSKPSVDLGSPVPYYMKKGAT